MNIEKAIRAATSRQADIDSCALPKATLKRAKSKNELEIKYHPQAYGLYFCLHDKSYFEPCLNCRRTKAEGLANLLNL
jgi:hypothetical protein